MRLIVLPIFTLIALVIVCYSSESLTITYDSKCKSNDANSSMTHYSSFDEPMSQDNENIVSYKVKSFNYLEDGRIQLDYMLAYNGKIKRSYCNSSLYNKVDLMFEGSKGISELFAGEFEPTSGAISSSKRAWYQGFSILPKKQVLGDYYDEINLNNCNLYTNKTTPLWLNGSWFSDNINRGKFMTVNAEAIMGIDRNGSANYDFNYDAIVDNGIIDVKNNADIAPGFKSGRSDWVESALIEGNIVLNNDLRASI